MSRTLRASACGLALLAVFGLVRAAPRVEADPNRDYPITPDVGPWVICAAHYSGQEAPEFARQMVQWVRARQGVAAYSFNRADDPQRRAEREARVQAELQKEKQFPGYRARFVHVEDQCVVLVGTFPTVDAANAYLKTVRAWDLPDIHLPSGSPAFDRILVTGRTREGQEAAQERPVNPFQTAFVTRNPLLVSAARPKFDPAWVKLSSAEEYSLFKCPRPWTLAVRQYNGLSATVTAEEKGSFFEKLWGGGSKREGESLAAAAFNAHELARVLRKLNFDAYVLHTRTSSVVTVGAFTSDRDPEMRRTAERLAALHNQYVAANKPDPLGLMLPPPPMEVPHPER
jgi:hypothetical protein